MSKFRHILSTSWAAIVVFVIFAFCIVYIKFYALPRLHAQVDDIEELRKRVEAVDPSLAMMRRYDSSSTILEKCRAKTISPNDLVIRGKALIWHLHFNELPLHCHGYCLVNDELPESIKASAKDTFITMFLIDKYRCVTVGKYSVTSRLALQDEIDVCVVYWPSNEPIGMFTLKCNMPPDKVPVITDNNPIRGDHKTVLLETIRRLRTTESRRLE
jgi:hypothetical protein